MTTTNSTPEFIKDDLRVFVVPFDILQESLSIYAKMVYCVLRAHVNAVSNQAFPSYGTIAELGSMSRRKAIDAVQELLEHGYLTKEIRLDVSKNRKIKNTSNLYTIASKRVVHDMHHPSAQDAPPPVHDMHHPSAQDAPENNHLKYIKDDDDKREIAERVFLEFEGQITKEQFEVVAERVSKLKTTNYQNCLRKSIETEIHNLSAAVAKVELDEARKQVAVTRPARTGGRRSSQRPEVLRTPKEPEAPQLSEEAIQKLREKVLGMAAAK